MQFMEQSINILITVKKKMTTSKQEGHTEDIAFVPGFKTPLEADFPTFGMLLDVGPADIALNNSKDVQGKLFKLV